MSCLLLIGPIRENCYWNYRDGPYKLDFRDSVENIMTHIIKPFGVKDIYISTRSKDISDVEEVYCPKKIILHDSFTPEGECIISALKLIESKNYDTVIMCRPFISFKRNIKDLVKDGINFPWKEENEVRWKQHKRISDSFWIFSSKYISIFIDALQKNDIFSSRWCP